MPHHTSSGWARGEPVAQTLTASAAPAVPRFGRWLCVLPGWQLNVNVNVRSFCVTRFTVNKKAPVPVRVDVRCVWVSRVVVCLSALFVGSGSRVCPVRG